MKNNIKYGLFITQIRVYNDFFSFGFFKKYYKDKDVYSNFDDCIVYRLNDFACDKAYNINSVFYKKLYKEQNKLYYMIEKYRTGENINLLKDYCIKNEIEIQNNFVR